MNEIAPTKYDPTPDALTHLTREIALLSGRVELTMRLLSRILSKMDPAFLDDPHDPEVRLRLDLLGRSMREKLKQEALAQASFDPEQFRRLRDYFKDVT